MKNKEKKNKEEKIDKKEIFPIKITLAYNNLLLKNNQDILKKKKDKNLIILNKVIKSNMHYLNKMMINQDLNPEEIEVSEERIKELINYGN